MYHSLAIHLRHFCLDTSAYGKLRFSYFPSGCQCLPLIPGLTQCASPLGSRLASCSFFLRSCLLRKLLRAKSSLIPTQAPMTPWPSCSLSTLPNSTCARSLSSPHMSLPSQPPTTPSA